MSNVSNQAKALAGKYLLFEVTGVKYAIPVTSVREIIRVCGISPTREMELPFIGILNLRGRVMPVFDLRRKFGATNPEPATENAQIVVQFKPRPDQVQVYVSLIVDAVDAVGQFKEGEIESLADAERSYVIGRGKNEQKEALILDLPALIGPVPACTNTK